MDEDLKAIEEYKGITVEERKKLFKDAMKEWMNEERQHVEATVGRWVIRSLAGMAIVALMYFILWMNGWHRLI